MVNGASVIGLAWWKVGAIPPDGVTRWLSRAGAAVQWSMAAMTGPQLVGYVEAKLAECGAARKVLPPPEVVAAEAEEAYRRDLEALAQRLVAELLDVPGLVRRALRACGPAGFRFAACGAFQCPYMYAG